MGIRLSPRRLGSRRSGQSYASNQHRRGMDSIIVISHISNSALILLPMNKAIIPQPENGHQLRSCGQLKQLGAMSHPRAKTDASCQSISVSQHAPAFVLLFGFSNISITEGIYFWSSQRGNDETSLRFSPSFHGPYNLCGSCRQWFA